MGSIQSIFNLGVVLKDAILENQTVQDYKTSFEPKAYATENLDKVTREMCPDLRDFVVFSSVSCGRGNAGQTNYGMSNSVMERICEKRKKEGYPALAIQWGAVGDVGLVAEMQESNTELVIGGTLQQRITNCLDVLDKFLRQEEPIVSSMVVAEKRSGSGRFDNAIDAVAHILGLRDIKIVSPHSTLPELGMDSIMAVEIKQILEQEYDIILSPQEMRSLTFARIQELQKEKEAGNVDNKRRRSIEDTAVIEMIIQNFCTSTSQVILDPCIEMKEEAQNDDTLFIIPGVEGFAPIFKPIVSNLKATSVKCLQYPLEIIEPEKILEVILNYIYPSVKASLCSKKTFNVLAHSYGTIVALEIISRLEKEGITCKALFLDGSPDLMKEICIKSLPINNTVYLETTILCGLMSLYMPKEVIESAKVTISLFIYIFLTLFSLIDPDGSMQHF